MKLVNIFRDMVGVAGIMALSAFSSGCAALSYEIPYCTPSGAAYTFSPDLCECGIELEIEREQNDLGIVRPIYIFRAGSRSGNPVELRSSSTLAQDIFYVNISGEELNIDSQLTEVQRADLDTYSQDFENHWQSGFATYLLRRFQRC